MNKPKIKTVLSLMYEGFMPCEVDTGGYGADDAIVMATDMSEAINDVLLNESLEEAPDGWYVREMEASELLNHYAPWRTTLGVLRQFPGWQDAGQIGEKDLTDDLPVVIYPDGAVQIDDENGYIDLCPAPAKNHGNTWILWLAENYA